MTTRNVLPADVELSDEGVRFHEPEGYWGTLSPPRAQALAVEILARWPLDRVERDTMADWRADASRYLKDDSMLTRRFARRVLALVDGFEEKLAELSAKELVAGLLGGKPERLPMVPGPLDTLETEAGKPAKPEPLDEYVPSPAEFLADVSELAADAVKMAKRSNAGEFELVVELGGYTVELRATEKQDD